MYRKIITKIRGKKSTQKREEVRNRISIFYHSCAERWHKRPLSIPQKVFILKRLSQLLSQGYAVSEAIQILSVSAAFREKRLLYRLSSALAQGQEFEHAFRAAGFSEYIVMMIAQAQMHGNLADSLLKASEWKQRKLHIRREWQKVLFYPFVLLLVMMLMLYLIFYLVIPQFQLLFHSFSMDLPTSTQWMLAFFSFMERSFTILITVIVLALVSFYWFWRQEYYRLLIFRSFVRLPLIHSFYLINHTLWFSVQLGFLIQAKVPLHHCLQKLKEQATNVFLREKLVDLEHKILSGQSVGEALRGEEMFLPELHPVVFYAERNGQLGQSLLQFGFMLEKEWMSRWLARIKWTEPLLLLILGGCIAYIFIALFAPMLQFVEHL